MLLQGDDNMSDFNAIYPGSLTDLNNNFHTSPDRPLLGIDTENEALYINTGQNGWVNVGSTSTGSGGGAQFSVDPITITAVTGQTTYTLPFAPANPEGSFFFRNGVKQTFGLTYSVSGDSLTILGSTLPVTGDSLQLFAS
jgi:hypothetical protein